jgi:DNA invertase Pin-like site-specific DNA recombinase
MIKPRAFSYLRISTPGQALGHGVQRQLEASRKYAEEHNLELVEGDELRDIGVSAFKGDNVADGALGRFLTAVRTGKIEHGSTLIVESLDRISRQRVMKSMGLLIEIVNSGVNVATLADGRTYTSGAGFEEMIYSIVALSRAHDESKTKSMRVASAWSNKRKNASTRKLTAQCPAWLKLSDDKKTFHVIAERAEVVRGIFQDSADGIGIYTITQRLNRDRVPAFGKTNWHESYVRKILANRAVIGEFQPHRMVDGKSVPDGEPLRDYFPRVIDDDPLFYRAQAGRELRRTRIIGRKGEGISNLFSGLVKCAYCNSRMVFERKRQTYLTCYSAKRGLGCIGKRWRYEEFEQQFLSFVKEIDLASLVHSDDDAKKRAALDAIITSLRGEVASIKIQMDRMIELLEVAGTATNYVAGKLQELENRKVAVEKDLAEKEQELIRGRAVVNVQEVKNLVDRIRDTSGDDAYRLRSMIAARLRSIVDTILVAPAGDAPKTEKTIEFLRGQPGTEGMIEQLEKTIDGRRYFAAVMVGGRKRIVHSYPPGSFPQELTWPFPKE